MYRRIIMNRDEYQIRAAFKGTYGFHKVKNRLVARSHRTSR